MNALEFTFSHRKTGVEKTRKGHGAEGNGVLLHFCLSSELSAAGGLTSKPGSAVVLSLGTDAQWDLGYCTSQWVVSLDLMQH